MVFNSYEYAKAIDDFLLKMDAIPSEFHPDSQSALDRIGTLLRIAEITVDFYETPLHEQQNKGEHHALYQKGQADFARSYQHRETTRGGNFVIYTFFQKTGEEDWTAEETEKLHVLAKMIYVFNGRVRTLRMVEKLVYYDRDFKMPNLTYFLKHTSELIARGCIGNYVACYFNLRHFSPINQQFGRDKGNEVMSFFIQHLSDCLSDEEIVCRIGGDNFITLFLKSHLDAVMNCLLGTEYISTEPTEMHLLLTASAGYYMIPETCTAVTDIMDCVCSAINIARNLTKESYVFYDEQLKNRIDETKSIQDMFPEAIKKQEFLVYYQPKYNINTNKIIGAEALCRWQHDGNLISPGRFIPVLEQSKAICVLDFYMLEHVCMDIRKWLDEGRPVVKISVNLSRCHFDDMDLLKDIMEIIDKHHVPHEYIEIELTETTTDVSFKDLKRIVYSLKEQGVSTSIDDFGIGYSSLNLLRELPWDVLKIDKSFLAENPDSPKQNQVMLKHIIAMTQELGIECIVEGVETPEHVDLLKEHNCYLAQGFLFDRPMPKENFEAKLESLK
ncbi:MAG: putative bifunctional diguanylate cyclase/phosphodiesterase [Acetatifactor sp.]